MKLFLSSIRLPNDTERQKLFGDKKNLSVTIIPNAGDTYPAERQKMELESTISSFKELGYTPSVLDLVTSSTEQQKANLASCDFIWVTGGNSFYLNYRVQESDFDKLITQALHNGVAYGGASAGAIIACPTLHGVENVDDPNDAPRIIWEGLSLVDFGIVPHWGMEKYADKPEKMADEMRPYVPQMITLTNDQAIVVVEDIMEIA